MGWGTHVNPWLIHVNVWQKPLQYCKVISLQLIKINGKKNSIFKKQTSLSGSSTAGEKDLKLGPVHNEKTDVYNLASKESGSLLLFMAGRLNGSFQPTLLLVEVTSDH